MALPISLHHHHVGIFVSDLDRSIQWYHDIFGFELVAREIVPLPTGMQEMFVNSWFYIGRANVEGHELVFLFHLMSGTIKGAGLMDTVVSILDKTEGFYESKDIIVTALKPVKVKNGGLDIVTDCAALKGHIETGVSLSAQLKEASLDVVVYPEGNVIYNGGSGFYPLLRSPLNGQYSCPEMVMKGNITVKGKKYSFEDGFCWFDRQWNNRKFNDLVHMNDYNPKWMWMGITLDNGEYISLWEVVGEDGINYCFATTLHTDGTQTVSQIPSAVKTAGKPWHSKVTGQNYPTEWKVRIPDFDMELNVVCDPAHQEIISEMAPMNKYEAESRITGTMRGKSITGACCVELLGKWE